MVNIKEEYGPETVGAAKQWDAANMKALAAEIEDSKKKIKGTRMFGMKTKAQKAKINALQKKADVADKASQELRKMKAGDEQKLVRTALGISDSYEIDKPTVEEDGEAAITTGNIGSPTMATGEPAKGGSSALYYPKVGPMVSRRGDIKPKKKKKVREFTEYYFN